MTKPLVLIAGVVTLVLVAFASGVDNDEQRTPVMVCRGPDRPRALEWPALRDLG